MAAARQVTPQRGSGGWPPDIKPCLCVTMKSVLNAKPPLTASAYSASLGTRFARLGRFPMGRAHPQGAVTRLCVKCFYTFYMFYTVKKLLLRAKLGQEVHLESAGELGRSAEGEVDVLAQHLGDVGARDLHALGEVSLGDAQLLHAQENLA